MGNNIHHFGKFLLIFEFGKSGQGKSLRFIKQGKWVEGAIFNLIRAHAPYKCTLTVILLPAHPASFAHKFLFQ